jgi:hypothetical protein
MNQINQASKIHPKNFILTQKARKMKTPAWLLYEVKVPYTQIHLRKQIY